MTTHYGFTIEVRDGHVMVAGELDIRSGPEMAVSLLALSAEAHRLAVDLSAVDFIDARGLRALLSLKVARPEFRVVAVSPRVERVLDITKTHDVLADDDLSETR